MPTDSSVQKLSYAQALHQAASQVMARDPRVIVIGEGVPDPKGIFGTTANLRETFGANRVFDMPLSENGMTGICIGAALGGMRPLMVHQRIDFALLAMDQLVNNAAKWHYMFNGQARVPLVVRMIIGRGWGQGPQHSQGLQSLFAHVPGLKVVMPSTPHDAKGMLIAALEDDNPVIFVEHRWLHNVVDDVPEAEYRVPLDKARLLHSGDRLTVAGFSFAILEALQLARELARHGIALDVVDMRAARPLDLETLARSVRKTGHLIAVDSGWGACGLASELIALMAMHEFASLRKAPARLTYPDHPSPTSPHLSSGYFPSTAKLLNTIMLQLGMPLDARTSASILERLVRKGPMDVPSVSFTGPF
jgi:pyruvate dehydrogenase E1 component beta subunit